MNPGVCQTCHTSFPTDTTALVGSLNHCDVVQQCLAGIRAIASQLAQTTLRSVQGQAELDDSWRSAPA